MPRKFNTYRCAIPVAATGTTHDYTIPTDFGRSKAMTMILVTPDYTTGTPTTTTTFRDKNSRTYFADSARAENSTFIVSLGSLVVEVGDTIRLTLSAAAGGATTVYITFHLEE